jgi:ADP-heptose:LPS heptosyltransferase
VKHQHILVIRFSSLGDVAMTVPVVYAVARRYPDVRITVLSRSYARPLFEDLAPNVNFMVADIKSEYRGLGGLNALYRRLVAKQFTHVADLHSVLRSGYLRLRFNLGHFKVNHINKHRKSRRRLVAKKGKVRQQLPSSFDNYLEVFRRLGFPVDHIDFHSIFPPEGGNLNLLPRIVGEKRSWEQWIGIAPFAAHKGKIYPPEKMLKVIELLTQRYPKARLFLFGRGKDEDSVFEKWEKDMPQCVAVGNHIETLHQELILMSHLDVMLSMDSANMHLASLTATPVVSVWGATHPLAGFMGWRQNSSNAIGLDLDCRPCSIYGQKPCRHGDYRCMTGIAPETIVERIASVIEKKDTNTTN